MGSDDLFHKRKAKTQNQLKRKTEKRSSYERVLIVCEGSKTEPNYFNEFIDFLELNSANVEIDGSCDSSPGNIVKYAQARYTEERKTGDRFDKVYCVFDKDTHASYASALETIKSLQPKDTFKAANSVPCFEYWILLHFEYTTKPFTPTGRKSSCYSLIDDLKKYLPDYDKGNADIYCKVSEETQRAIAFSKKSLKEAEKNHTDNPSTYVHELVEYLVNLKDRK